MVIVNMLIITSLINPILVNGLLILTDVLRDAIIRPAQFKHSFHMDVFCELDLYGKVNAEHYFSSSASDDGDKTYARLGFKGETQIASDLTGFGQWEYEFKGNRTESQGADKDKTRLAFAGLRFGDYGSIDYGRNYGVTYDIGAWTDVLPEFGGDTWTQTDVFMTQRATGVATYRNNDFFGLVDGLNFALQYQGKNDSASKVNNWKGRDEVESGFAPIFPDICYHLTHYRPAAADIPVASDNPTHYADAIRYNARTPL